MARATKFVLLGKTMDDDEYGAWRWIFRFGIIVIFLLAMCVAIVVAAWLDSVTIPF